MKSYSNSLPDIDNVKAYIKELVMNHTEEVKNFTTYTSTLTAKSEDRITAKIEKSTLHIKTSINVLFVILVTTNISIIMLLIIQLLK